ncbi:MAG: hypothetical protein IJX11_02625 [Bacteroidales bacterium]|nr:hypothetical protein [Bacteroidales bacterium]
MKIAVIEKYKCTHNSYRAGRSGGEWDYEDISSHSYNYYFFSDQKEIGEKEYKIIHNFLNSQNKSYTENTSGINEEHISYDCERSSILAEKLNCQIFEPGISHKSVFEHNTYLTTEIIEHETLPVIKYRKLVKDQDYWKGTDKWTGVRLDKDGNLCHGWGDSEIKLSTV